MRKFYGFGLGANGGVSAAHLSGAKDTKEAVEVWAAELLQKNPQISGVTLVESFGRFDREPAKVKYSEFPTIQHDSGDEAILAPKTTTPTKSNGIFGKSSIFE